MKKEFLRPVERIYANNGQQAEYAVKVNRGVVSYADNRSYTLGGDIDGLQIKSCHATVCKGLDIRAHVASDKATSYGYVTKDMTTLYTMTPSEYIEMVERFSFADKDSSGERKGSGAKYCLSGAKRGGAGVSNGGGVKLRLKRCEKQIVEWLEGRL